MRFLLVALSALSLCGVTPAFAETIPSAISAPASGLISVGPLVAPDVTMTAASPTVSAGCPAASYGGSGPAAVTSFLTYSKAAGGQWKAVPDAGIGGGYGWSLGLAPDTTASCSPRLLISGLVLGNVLSAQSPGSVRLTPGLSFGIRCLRDVRRRAGRRAIPGWRGQRLPDAVHLAGEPAPLRGGEVPDLTAQRRNY